MDLSASPPSLLCPATVNTVFVLVLILMVWGVPASYFLECLPNFIFLLFFWGHFGKEKTEVWKGGVNEYVIVMWHHHTVSTFITLWDCICQPFLLPLLISSFLFPGIQPTKSTPPLKCRSECARPPAEAGWPQACHWRFSCEEGLCFSPHLCIHSIFYLSQYGLIYIYCRIRAMIH